MQFFWTQEDGGLPLELNDFRWWNDGTISQFAAILMAWKPKTQDPAWGVPPANSLIVSGCAWSGDGGTGVTWTGGVVMIAGLMYTVQPSTSPVTFNAFMEGLYFETSTVWSPLGLKDFQSGPPPKNTYGVRMATPTVKPMGTNELLFHPDSPRFLAGLQQADSQWITIATGEWLSNWTGTLKYRKNALGEVEFRGTINRIAAHALSQVTRTKIGYRVGLSQTHLCPNTATGGYNQVTFGTDGYISVSGTFAAGDVIDLSGCRLITVPQ